MSGRRCDPDSYKGGLPPASRGRAAGFLTAAALLGGAALLSPLRAQTQPDGEQAAQLFQSRCGMCHTIGGGRRRGPDLAIVRNLPVDMVRKNVERMQAKAGPLTPAEINTLVSYLTGKAPLPKSTQQPLPGGMPPLPAGQTGLPGTQAPGPAPVQAGGPGDWNSLGAKLYSGRVPLSNGGPSCMACHSMGPGGQAPPLCEIAHEKRGGRLLGFLQNPGNRAMRQAYAAHPITLPEAQALSAYFQTVNRGPGQAGMGAPWGRRGPGIWGEREGSEGDDD